MARKKYCDALKSQIISEYKNGKSQISLAKQFKLNRSIICRLIKKYNATNSVVTVHSGGRPRKTSVRDDRLICAMFKKNPFATSQEVAKTLNLNINACTVRRRAIENNLKVTDQPKNHC